MKHDLVVVVAMLGVAAAVMWTSGDEQEPSMVASARSSVPAASSVRPPVGLEPAPTRPLRPPVPGVDEPPSFDEPTPPADAEALRKSAYDEAVAMGEPRPGEKAFRAMVGAFVDHNHRFAEEQARSEGLEVDEIEELTVLGLLAQQSQRWSEVEQILGRSVDADARSRSAAMLTELDGDFEQDMRALVADGASAEDRWALIRSFEDEYRDRYFELTGMDEDLLDDLLAGDAARDYAPGTTPIPQDIPRSEAGMRPVPPRAEAP